MSSQPSIIHNIYILIIYILIIIISHIIYSLSLYNNPTLENNILWIRKINVNSFSEVFKISTKSTKSTISNKIYHLKKKFKNIIPSIFENFKIFQKISQSKNFWKSMSHDFWKFMVHDFFEIHGPWIFWNSWSMIFWNSMSHDFLRLWLI